MAITLLKRLVTAHITTVNPIDVSLTQRFRVLGFKVYA